MKAVTDRAVRAQLHGDAQLCSRLAGRRLQRQPAARSRLAHDERLAREVLEGEATPRGKRMIRGRHHDQLVADERDDRQLRILGGGTDHGEVQLVAQDLLLDPRARTDLERYHQAGVELFESTEGCREEVDADRRARAHTKVATLDSTHLLDGDGGLVEDVEHPARVAVEQGAGFCQLDALAKAVQQRHAQRLLELLHLVRDRRLAQLEALRGQAEAVEVGHRLERAQLA